MNAVVEIVSACVLAVASASFAQFGVTLERPAPVAQRSIPAVSRVSVRSERSAQRTVAMTAQEPASRPC